MNARVEHAHEPLRPKRSKNVKCFLAGALLFFVMAAVIIPQYSYYTEAVRLSEWLTGVRNIQADIEINAIKQNSLMNADRDLDKEVFKNTKRKPDLFEITEAMTIILRGGGKGQIAILVPSLGAERVTWHCVGGGPNSAVPSGCIIY